MQEKYDHEVLVSCPINEKSLLKHAHALELLEEQLTRDGARALDVGSGSGYLTACMALMVMILCTVCSIFTNAGCQDPI